jgi:hypothetical protein
MPNSDNSSSTSTDASSSNVPNLDVETGTQGNTIKNAFDPPKSEAFNEERWRERTRTYLALGLFLSIGFTQLSVFFYLFTPAILQLAGKEKKDNKDLKDNIVKLNNSAFVYVVKDDKEDNNKDSRELVTLVWTSQVTLIGSALGFYFAANKEANK